MADPKGFMTTPRETPKRRPVDVRIKDWREVYEPQSMEHLQKQAGRCMIAVFLSVTTVAHWAT
jgi:glutamate synthase (NADPH/NADH) small chain